MNLSNDEMSLLTSDPLDVNSATTIATTVILIVISLMGTIGNGLVLWAFRCKVSKCVVSDLLIQILAGLDMIICSIGIPATLYLDVWQGEATEFLCRAHFAFKGFIVPISACVLVLIALERFLLICFIPGIGLSRTHLIMAFSLIFLIGVVLAIPMSLHVHAVKIVKFHDVLFQPVPFDEERLESESLNLLDEFHVPVRCNKDDTFISDTTYWYYQIVIITLFAALFLVTALLYVVVFLFVWRHESLMFERYGKSKYRGYFIRIHASIAKPVKDSERCPKPDDHQAKPKSSTRPHKVIRGLENRSVQLSLGENSAPVRARAVSDHAFGESATHGLDKITCACRCDGQNILDAMSISGIEDTTKFRDPSLARLSDACQGSKVENVSEPVIKPLQMDKPIRRDFTARYLCCCCCDKSASQMYDHRKDSLLIYKLIAAEHITEHTHSHENLIPKFAERQQCTAKAVKSIERRRKPHVYTAKNFAMIAAAFTISYTPYLVYTAMPVNQRSLTPNTDTGVWSNIGRVLFYLYFANSAANPIIYSCMNRHFRSFLSKQFCANQLVSTSRHLDKPDDVAASADCKTPKQPVDNSKPDDFTFEAS
ncbi:Amine GPCR [Fasciolopsis buskii]|uniref:Amine GPCR n=2 Tax=Fasciolopsis buskii TaxID=27845 RepID=A0A8E0RWT3_9TREM|nr:Amine GPCR [Fasciolopsis buski]